MSPYLGYRKSDPSVLRRALQTTIADNVGLVERAWVDSINKRSKEKFLELHGESAVLYDPTLGSLKGRPALD